MGPEVGWIPRHLACIQDDRLVAAMPLYEKHNSWGEFVFDHAWADAFHRYGIQYYPKLINAIPFTPASGQRILIDQSFAASLPEVMLTAAQTLMEKGEFSGLHCLFPSQLDRKLLSQKNFITRSDCQFHWHNRNYSSFENFLANLKRKKRKNIQQERRKVKESGVEILWLNGQTASEFHWSEFTRLYRRIYDRKYGMPAFNLEFFVEVAKTIPDQIHLVLAKAGNVHVAGALMYSDERTLYGRHWGCDQMIDCLHFEVCYYRGIEYCIEHGLKRFDPGAQGEHKIPRGFEPTQTYSLHWLSENPFHQAIERFAESEQNRVKHYIEKVKLHSPFISSHENH